MSPVDHRNRPVRLHMLATSRAARRTLESVPYETLMRIEARRREIIEPLPARPTFGDMIAFPLAAAFMPVMMLAGTGWSNLAVAIVVVLVPATFIIAIVLRVRAVNRRQAAAITAAYLEEHRCPACGYDLTGSEPRANGLTVCPECGAAWRMPSNRA